MLGKKDSLPQKSTWNIHILHPYGHIDDLNKYTEIDGFHKDHCEEGNEICSEWTPRLVDKLTQIINNLGVNSITWHKITMKNYQKIITSIPNNNNTIIFNLCDGNESTGWIGKSALRLIDSLGFAYTGTSPDLYELDEVKTRMKQYLVSLNANTPNYVNLIGTEDRYEIIDKINGLKMPVLIKPSNLSGSIGMTEKNVCHSATEALDVAINVSTNYGPVYIEEYITGREFTCLCFGSEDYGVDVLVPLERVFRKDIPDTEKFLSYKTKWIDWLNTWWYCIATSNIIEEVKRVAADTFIKAKLNGYCRYDMREDRETGKIYVVDVNLNCSMDVDDESSLQIILKNQGIEMHQLLEEFFWFALYRKSKSIQDKA
ncbi:D-alanine--D-alanine ligase [Fadolivirus algeromassiliense]|uniref:D-alanine--D-alanine ligase n=1 Tax=Fadolivirus FV1/VV64 TaxID=3070911 RepID=A0A7D3UTH2_9VIRU|nr:D-alanine--D-alanine ligase [Fadolivirus algeromassiliense]QKF93491.1 D-alanine--D-alanine ligase [Fadolivirus FV1/VV64]